MALIRPTRDDARRISSAVRRVESMPVNDPPRQHVPQPPTIELHLVKIVSTTQTDGRHRARRYDYDAADRSKTEAELCWLDPANSGVLRDDIYYWSKLVGELADGAAVYSPAGDFGKSYRYYCVAGALKEYIVHSGGGLEYIRDVACCDTTCQEIDPCVNDCDADDVAAALCMSFFDEGSFLVDAGALNTEIELTETGANDWTGSGTTADGLGTLTVNSMTPLVNDGGYPCGGWIANLTFNHPSTTATFEMSGTMTCDPVTISFSHTAATYATVAEGECDPGSGSGGGGDCTSVAIGWPSCDVEEIACTQTVQATGTGGFASIPAAFGVTYHSTGTFSGMFVSNDLGLDGGGPSHLVWNAGAGQFQFDLVDETNSPLAGGAVTSNEDLECFADGTFYLTVRLTFSGGTVAAGTLDIVIDGEAA